MTVLLPTDVPPVPPPSRPPGGSEEGIRQSFIWALVAGIVPVCGLPMVLGLTWLGKRQRASPSYERWYRRLVALAVLDIVVAAVSFGLSAKSWRQPPQAGKVLAAPRVLGVVADPEPLPPPPRGLFERQPEGAPMLTGDMWKGVLGLVLPMGALLGLWAVGRRRGADARPLLVLGALVVSGIGALVTARGLSAVLGGPSRGLVLLSGAVNAGVLLLVAAVLARRAAPAEEAPESRDWLRSYFASVGLLITLGVRAMVLMGGVSQMLGVLPDQNQHPMVEMARQGPLGLMGWGLLIIPAALLAPVGEELLFRGVLLPWLSGWMGRVAALTVSAGVFASLHLFYGVFTGWIFFLGLLLGWARLASGGLRAPMLLHVTINSFALLMLSRTLSG